MSWCIKPQATRALGLLRPCFGGHFEVARTAADIVQAIQRDVGDNAAGPQHTYRPSGCDLSH